MQQKLCNHITFLVYEAYQLNTVTYGFLPTSTTLLLLFFFFFKLFFFIFLIKARVCTETRARPPESYSQLNQQKQEHCSIITTESKAYLLDRMVSPSIVVLSSHSFTEKDKNKIQKIKTVHGETIFKRPKQDSE